VYQPIVELATGRITGVEALVRWDHPTRGRIEPADFIRVAEESDLILEIGRWVLSEAASKAREWREIEGCGSLTVSVNVAARQLSHPDFVDEVLGIIHAAGCGAHAIVLETTETAMLEDIAATRQKLRRLADDGIAISVDDFGTGYSSLSYLQQFPASTLKIARDFVGLDVEDNDGWQLARAIIAMADALHLNVIAEGVETAAQLQRLVELGCGSAQGFYLARPLDVNAVTGLLTHHRTFPVPAHPPAETGGPPWLPRPAGKAAPAAVPGAIAG